GIEKGIDRPALERFAELLHRAADRHLSRRAREPRDLLREELRDERDRLRLLSARLRLEERLEGRREQHSRDERLRSRLGRSVAPKLRDALSKRIELVRLDRRHELRRPPLEHRVENGVRLRGETFGVLEERDEPLEAIGTVDLG